jgi:hypothetical protein
MTDWLAYFRDLAPKEEPVAVRPAPEVSSRAPWPGDFGPPPGPVLKLAQDGREAGWEVLTAYSRGYGLMYRGSWQCEERISLRFGLHPKTGRQAYAIYRRTAGEKAGAWTWHQVYLWGPDLTPFGLCTVTDLRYFLAAGGRVSQAWLWGVALDHNMRHTVAEWRIKTRPKKASKIRAESGG